MQLVPSWLKNSPLVTIHALERYQFELQPGSLRNKIGSSQPKRCDSALIFNNRAAC